MSNVDSSFALQKKKRRSSLFIDRPPILINESTDSATTTASTSDGQLSNHITQLKNCKRSWKRVEKHLKSQLNSPKTFDAQRKMYDDVKNNYLDYLSEEDRKFMEEMSPLLEGSTNDKKIDTVKENLLLLVDSYEESKKQCMLLFENICRAYRLHISKKFNEFGEVAGTTLPEFDFEDIRVGDNVPQILEYNSDLSDLED